jgi:tetratricopeptide (TPR) repeat protein
MLEAESTGNFDIGIGTASLSWFIPLLRAQSLTVEGRYAEAVELFAENLDSAERHGVARLLVSFLADSAWCKFKLGLSKAALEDAHSCIRVANDDCDPDDLAASLARVAAILEANAMSDVAASLRQRSTKCLEAHTKAQAVLLQGLLKSFPDGNWPAVQH